jgi:hypothetical protein
MPYTYHHEQWLISCADTGVTGPVLRANPKCGFSSPCSSVSPASAPSTAEPRLKIKLIARHFLPESAYYAHSLVSYTEPTPVIQTGMPHAGLPGVAGLGLLCL